MIVRLPVRLPFDPTHVFGFLALRAVAGVEVGTAQRYARTLRLAHGAGLVELAPATDHVRCELGLADDRDRDAAVAAARRLLDLDLDPEPVGAVLGADRRLAPLVAARPGLRVPGAVDAHELAFRAVLGQQISVAAARTAAARLVAQHGEPLGWPAPQGLTHLFPTASAIAALDPMTLPMPRQRGAALVRLAEALATGQVVLEAGAVEPAEAYEQLCRLRGLGPWTAGYILQRALGAPDVFLATDLGVRKAARPLGLPDDPVALAREAEAWRPWRSYAMHHLWSTLA